MNKMDYLDSGMRYNPKSGDDSWDTGVQFLPASNSKKLEKKGPKKVLAIVAVLVFITVISVMTGLLVWHFHFRKEMKVFKMYAGTMLITSETFQDAYEDSASPEFSALAAKVQDQLKTLYSNTPQLARYYVRSTVNAFSEGSVIAYYISEFDVPANQEAAVDSALAEIGKKMVRSQRKLQPQQLRVDEVVTLPMDPRMARNYKCSYNLHAKPGVIGSLSSPGFPNSPYPADTHCLWRLRADPGYVLKLNFITFSLEDDCSKDFARVYDSLGPLETRVLAEKCGTFSPSQPLVLVSSGNVMLLALVTDDNKNFPGFKAEYSQIPKDSSACGGQLTGSSGTFNSPNYPAFYSPRMNCTWKIQVSGLQKSSSKEGGPKTPGGGAGELAEPGSLQSSVLSQPATPKSPTPPCASTPSKTTASIGAEPSKTSQSVLLVSPSSMPQLSSVLCTSQPSPLPPHQQLPHQAGMQPAARVMAHSVTSTLPQVRVVTAQAGLATSAGSQQASLVHQGHQQIRVPVTVAHSKGITQTMVTLPLRTQSAGSPVQVQASRTQTSITVTGLASAVTVTKSSLSSPGSPAHTSTPSTVLQSIAGQNIIKQVRITGQLGMKSQAGAGIPLTATNLRIQGKDVLRLPPSSITTDSTGQTVLRITPDMMATLTKSPVTTVKLTPDMLSASSGGRPLSATLHVTSSSSAADTVSAIKAACSSAGGGATSLVKSEAASIRLMPALAVTMADQKGKTVTASTDSKPATTIRIMPGLGVIPQKPGQTITVATAGGKQVPASSSGAPVSGAATVTIATGHKGGTSTPFSLGAGTATMRQVPVSATVVSTTQQGKLPARITVPLSVLSQPLKGKSMVTAPLLKGNIGTNISSLGRNIILTTMPAGTKLIAGNKPVSFVTAQQLQQLQQQGQATQVRIQTVQTQHLQQRTASGSPKPVSTVVVTTAPSPKRTPDPQ
ncbi:nuclear factor related to kappa-B-binding protein-like [Polyodon spathula]|uniref:nuclear factor related to kappa-B-binding protein-like n=1 Tax=Polyodon spathula TaxID=7913 RepID=UPI001B7E5024|nr:nuclear factor related to kappa-B-binding protein-like [Polyodon spathula]